MIVGLYGGTFDPIHNGHVHVISQLISRGLVDRIIVVPAGQPQLRDGQPHATGAQRRAMCQLAINSLPDDVKSKVEVNPIEILREGPSYTIDTVAAIAATYPEATVAVIVGTDAFAKIDQWHRSAELQELADFLVIDRPGAKTPGAIDIGALNISATEIRTQEADQVPEAVAAYIKENNLYGR